MRRLSFLLAGATVWLFLAAVPVFADGGPHIATINSGTQPGVGMTSGSCAGCHRAHTAQGYNLTVDDGEALCFVCHSAAANGATTDVRNGVQYWNIDRSTTGGSDGSPVAGALRNGGFDFARIGTGPGLASRYTYLSGTDIRQRPAVPALAAGVGTTSEHNIGVAGPAWGNGPINPSAFIGANVTLECTTCHNPHGNGQFRILNPIPISSTAGGFFKPAAGVNVTDAPVYGPYSVTSTKNYTIHQVKGSGAATSGTYWLYLGQVGSTQPTSATSGDYFHRAVPWNVTAQGGSMNDAPNGVPGTSGASGTSLDGFNRQISAWCATCHTRLLADDVASIPQQTSSGDAVFKYRHGTNRSACTTCHVSHGTNASMTGMPANYDLTEGSGITTLTTSSFLLKADNRGTCQLCHDPTGTVLPGTTIGPGITVP